MPGPRFVLTGGPCAGKTTAKATLLQRLRELGYNTIFVPETATDLLGCGINVSEMFSVPGNALEFQHILFKRQLDSEGHFEWLSSRVNNPLQIYDRGACDGRVYMPDAEFVKMINSHGFEVGSLFSRYDVIFYLVTAADGAREFYNLDNEARQENADEALLVDRRTQRAWFGHPDFRIIANVRNGQQITFAEKMDWLMEEVMSAIGQPIPIKTQYKFLLPFDSGINSLLHEATEINITQTYLHDYGSKERRVRRLRYSEKDVSYFYTEKTHYNERLASRFTAEKQISADEYIVLLTDQRDVRFKQITKTRYCFTWQNQYCTVDIFDAPEKLIVLEIQASKTNPDVRIPDFLSGAIDVTNDPRYLNYTIARGDCPGYEKENVT